MPKVKRTYWEDRLVKDKENLKQLQMGEADQALINAAYLGTRSATGNTASDWMNSVGGMFDNFMNEQGKIKLANQLADDALMTEIEGYSKGVLDAGYALGTDYYTEVYDGVDVIKNDYIDAVNSGNEKEQAMIRSKLHSLKTHLTQMNDVIMASSAVFADEDDRTKGLNANQKNVIEVCKPKNIEWDAKNNRLVWRIPGTTGEDGVLTLEDYENATEGIMKDYDSQKTIIDNSLTNKNNGIGFADGSNKEDFNESTQFIANEKVVRNGNIMSMMHDDLYNGQTFIQALEDHPDLNGDKLLKLFSTDDGVPNYSRIKLLDANEDQKLSLADFAMGYFSEDELISVDTDEDGKISQTELDKYLGDNPTAKEGIDKLMRDKMIEVITNSDDDFYDEKASTNVLAKFLTLRDRNIFYGGMDPNNPTPEQEFSIFPKSDLHPNGNPLFETMTEAEYIKQGGNVGLLKKHYMWVDENSGLRGKIDYKWYDDDNNKFYGKWIPIQDVHDVDPTKVPIGGVGVGEVR